MANKFVRQGASGSGSGDDWTNAYTTLSAANTGASRGDTVYVADGSYSGATFNKAASGTSVITIKKATQSDHGTETGWDASYGDGQAVITSTVNPNTGYYTFDGVTGDGGQHSSSSEYGFLFEFAGGANQDCFYCVTGVGVAIAGLTFKHIAFKGISGDYTKQAVRQFSQNGTASDITIQNCFFDGMSQAYSAAGSHTDNLLFENNVCKNLYGSVAVHAEWINTSGGGNASKIRNSTIRYNFFSNSASTGIIVANNSDIEDTYIYGNVFDAAGGGNGSICGTSNAGLVRCRIYNNTFSRCGNSGWLMAGSTGRDADNEAYNNLVWNQSANRMTSVGQITADYNAYLSCTSVPSETNGQTGSSDPFVDSAESDFRLVENTEAGVDLGLAYSTDIAGSNRTTWTRGAYEFGGPSAPSDLMASAIGSSSVDLDWVDNSSDETGFKVERSVDEVTWFQVGTVGAGVTSYSDGGLFGGTTYFYRVRAYNASGNSAYSNTASDTTDAPPIIGPSRFASRTVISILSGF